MKIKREEKENISSSMNHNHIIVREEFVREEFFREKFVREEFVREFIKIKIQFFIFCNKKNRNLNHKPSSICLR